MFPLLQLLVSLALLGPAVSSRDYAASIVAAPNAGRTAGDLGEASPKFLADHRVAAQFRTAVDRPGVPAASIDAFAFEPRDEDLTIALADDGRTFERHEFSPRDPAGAATRPAARAPVVILHGLRGSKERRFETTLPPVFTTAGYRVIQPDLRGHGRSTGDHLGYGVFESADLSAVLDEATRRGAGHAARVRLPACRWERAPPSSGPGPTSGWRRSWRSARSRRCGRSCST